MVLLYKPGLADNPELVGELDKFKMSSVTTSLTFLSFLFFFRSISSDCFNKDSSSDRLILRILQMSLTALNTTEEKLTFSLTVFMFGKRSRSILCWGVKSSLASACTPHLSRVQWVFSSQHFFLSLFPLPSSPRQPALRDGGRVLSPPPPALAAPPGSFALRPPRTPGNKSTQGEG